ncbi:MAG: ribonuclease H-like domain-containing protein [Candidatus Acetothermia bacterium]
MKGSPMAVDIETVGLEWSNLDQPVRDYLLSRAKSEEERETVPEKLALNPGTGRIITIALWRPDQERGGVLLESEASEGGWSPWEKVDQNLQIYRGTEEDILSEFWRYLSSAEVGRLITFNGRVFDGPFLMIRSAILGIEPTRNFVPYRYNFERHCDLAEVVSFYGARSLESLDFWCRQTGIDSPKDGLAGATVSFAYEEGRMEEIAEYCLRDARATAELFRILRPVVELMDS